MFENKQKNDQWNFSSIFQLFHFPNFPKIASLDFISFFFSGKLKSLYLEIEQNVARFDRSNVVQCDFFE